MLEKMNSNPEYEHKSQFTKTQNNASNNLMKMTGPPTFINADMLKSINIDDL